jgi:hypothetical protein
VLPLPAQSQVWLQTTVATTEAAAQTAQITAGLGRAKTHGDCHADPGATSFRLLMNLNSVGLRGRRSHPLPLVAQRRAF